MGKKFYSYGNFQSVNQVTLFGAQGGTKGLKSLIYLFIILYII